MFMYGKLAFYIFVNKIVCVDVNCICFAHCMLHLAVVTTDIAKVRLTSVFNWRVIDYTADFK